MRILILALLSGAYLCLALAVLVVLWRYEGNAGAGVAGGIATLGLAYAFQGLISRALDSGGLHKEISAMREAHLILATQIEKIDTLPSEDRDCDPELSATRSQAKERLRVAFETLPERDRKVALLLYVHNLTQREVGEILGVTESRVCQIHGQITKKLRAELEVDEQLFSEVA